jgi:hypothetical protein
VLDSHEVPTTPNLRSALKHLQPVLAIWIDALCIDQRDDKERGHELWPMTGVYQHASSVVVWLGLDEGRSRKAKDFLNETGAFINK